MKHTDYYERMAKDLYERAYSDGYSDGLHKGRIRSTFERNRTLHKSNKRANRFLGKRTLGMV